MDKVTSAILDLLFKNKIFARCPLCNSFLPLFSVYNAHCPQCGNFNKDELLLVDLYNQKDTK